MVLRVAAAALAVLSLVTGTAIARAHPLAPEAMLVLVAVWAALSLCGPALWLAAVVAVLPLAGLASWTGWQVLEEFDILVLATAAGAYMHVALHRSGVRPAGRLAGLSTGGSVLIVLALVATGVAFWRGLAPGSELAFGWFDSYGQPFNSLRVAKPFPLAVLLLPPVVLALRRDQARMGRYLCGGMLFGLAMACAVVVWERVAFTGLLDFSTDYRATGPFWEMHVGGAALDGYLALTIPFVVWGFLNARGMVQWLALICIAALSGYAALATFSRGVYVGVTVGLLMAVMLCARQRDATNLPSIRGGGLAWMLAAAVAAIGALLAFRSGGYRAVGAVCGAFVLVLALGPTARRLALRDWVLALLSGLGLGALGAVLAPLAYKGVYWLYALLFVATLALAWKARRGGKPCPAVAALACFSWLLVASVSLAGFWGGPSAAFESAPVVAVLMLLVVWNARAREPLWRDDLHTRVALACMVMGIAGVMAVFGGGAYMKDRFATTESDFAGRLRHWHDGVNLLRGSADWLFGKGFGTFPVSYFFNAPDSMFPGAYQIETGADGRYLALSGPRFVSDRNEWLRISQRVPAVAGMYRVTLDARASREVRFYVEICEQHLLYWLGCATTERMVGTTPGQWQKLDIALDGRELYGGAWYAPRLAFFSMAVATRGERVDVDNVRVTGPDGAEVVANGDFSGDMARWFVISERIHLPWHIKSLFLNVLFDQGLAGLLAATLLVLSALWRLAYGSAREHPLAPCLAASICGFLAVGMFDSLLDVPRIAFLFHFLVLVAMVLRDPPRATPSPLVRHADPHWRT